MKKAKIVVTEGFLYAYGEGKLFETLCCASRGRKISSKTFKFGDWEDLPVLVNLLNDFGFEVHAYNKSTKSIVKSHSLLTLPVPTHRTDLYPHQRVGAAWLQSRTRALLGDEMGLGKTIQALTALEDTSRAVVVCPAVVKYNWAQEAERWAPHLNPVVISGRGSFRWPESGEIIILNPECFGDKIPFLPKHTNVTIIADEAHMFKNSKTKRTRRFRSVASKALRLGRVWLLTGTPLINKPNDLWGVLQAADLAREVFGTYRRFVADMGGARTGFNSSIEWGFPSEDVPRKLERVMLRRMRAEVLPNLPTKTYQTIPVPMGAFSRASRKILDDVDLEALEAAESLQHVDISEVQGLAKARKLLATVKASVVRELLDNFASQGEPVVVFSAHRSPVDIVRKNRAQWYEITGDTKHEDRAHAVERFQGGFAAGIAGTIGAMGVGVTLTRAHVAVFVDRTYTPAMNSQAEDRVCRIGQSRGVIIVDLVADHPVDEHLHRLLVDKSDLNDAVFSGNLSQPTNTWAQALEIIK